MLIEPTKQKLHSGEGKVSSRSGYFHKVSLWDQLEKCCKNYDNLFYKGVPIQLGGDNSLSRSGSIDFVGIRVLYCGASWVFLDVACQQGCMLLNDMICKGKICQMTVFDTSRWQGDREYHP